jgi:hypothetical protein
MTETHHRINKDNQAVLVSAILTVLSIVVLNITTEFNPYLRNILNQYFFNVWIAKGILTASIFIFSVIWFRNANVFRTNEDEVYFLRYLSFYSILSFLAIFLFYFVKFV